MFSALADAAEQPRKECGAAWLDKFSQKFVRMCVLRKQNASDIALWAMLIVMSAANYNTTRNRQSPRMRRD